MRDSKICPVCNVEFTPKSNHTKYCSIHCLNKNRWQGIKNNPIKREKSLKAANLSNKNRREARWAILLEKHGNKCAHCENTFHKCVYALHHIEPGTKKEKRDQSSVIIHGGTDEEFSKLLDSTILLCANCHRLLHNNGKAYGRI